MSTLLTLPGNGTPKHIYFIYNFAQVENQVLIILYDDEYKCWLKIPVDYADGFKQVNTIGKYTDTKTFHQIHSELKIIFKQRKQLFRQKLLYNFKLLSEHAVLLCSGCS